IITQVEQVLEKDSSTTLTEVNTQTGRIQPVVEVVNDVDRNTERTILAEAERKQHELAEEIKKLVLVFVDIVILDNRTIQRVIREVDCEELRLSLKVSSEEVKEIVFNNMSTRMAETYKEEMEYMGPVRLKDVEEAQTRIVSVIRRLEETGEIIIARGG